MPASASGASPSFPDVPACAPVDGIPLFLEPQRDGLHEIVDGGTMGNYPQVFSDLDPTSPDHEVHMKRVKNLAGEAPTDVWSYLAARWIFWTITALLAVVAVWRWRALGRELKVLHDLRHSP
jgi:hypothetical protein